jgi:hypothetical protein
MAMNEERIVTLNVQEDFAEKLATGRPVQALAELIWNGLDAEATAIKVTAEEGDVRLESMTVQDNGHGMSYEEAASAFEYLGGSWKKANNLSKNGKRHLHGKEGRGRLRALALDSRRQGYEWQASDVHGDNRPRRCSERKTFNTC